MQHESHMDLLNVIRIKYSDVNKTSLLLILPENHSSICQHASPADAQPCTPAVAHQSINSPHRLDLGAVLTGMALSSVCMHKYSPMTAMRAMQATLTNHHDRAAGRWAL